ncbi:hypothetical protein FB45DRAFT_753270 [Roridomyces roridus]|uniref:Uncharacterized protein n=1 Tax=Roridomyces roridus TaxID=1738132 RepID=A0AAD7FJJ8_9AGAR|nr:hypothetical protein FB45DRAFT_753270 [Roridomyces roridus]
MQPLPSPPTSHDYHFDEDDEEEEEHGSVGEDGGISTATAAPFYPDAVYEPPTSSSWYKPSYTVLLALAPPIANWLTGGDHLKDLLLLLLLVFYLHQLIEVPWNLYHAARPRRLPTSAVPSAQPLMATRAQSELRRLELFLLFICFLAPLLGVALLRSLATVTTGSPTPISWFSTSIFALLTGLRPLRELTARITSRTSILHTQSHAYTAPPPPPPTAPDAQVAALTAQVAALEAAVARLTQREEALYTYVEDALAPLEKGMRRVERRVGKLRAARKAEQEPEPPVTPGGSTIFVPAQRKSLLTTWLSSPTVNPIPMRPAPPPPVPKLQMPIHSPRRLHLDSIPEEEVEYVAVASTSSSVRTLPPAYSAPPPVAVHAKPKPALLTREAILALLPATPAALGRALVVLALWPVWLVLLPVRVGLRYLVGAMG